MVSAKKRIWEVLASVLLAVGLTTSLTPTAAFGAGASASDDVSSATSDSRTMFTTVKGLAYELATGFAFTTDFASVGPYTADTMSVPISASFVNGKGSGWTATWTRYAITTDDAGAEVSRVDASDGIVDRTVTGAFENGEATTTHDLTKDSFSAGGATKYEYFITVTDGEGNSITSSSPITVEPFATQYRTSYLTSPIAGYDKYGQWDFMLNGAMDASKYPNAMENMAELTCETGKEVSGVIRNDAHFDVSQVTSKQEVYAALAAEAAKGTKPYQLLDAWQFSVTYDKATPSTEGPLKGRLRLTMDVTDLVSGESSPNPQDLRLIRATVGANGAIETDYVDMFPYTVNGATQRYFQHEGRIFVSFTVLGSDYSTGNLGTIGVAAPVPPDTPHVWIKGEAAGDVGGAVTPEGVRDVLYTGSITYTFSNGNKSHLSTVYLEGKVVEPGDVITDASSANVGMMPALYDVDGSQTTIGYFGANYLTLEMSALGSLVVKDGAAVTSESSPLKLVALFLADAPSDETFKLTVRKMDHGTATVSYVDKDGNPQIADTVNGDVVVDVQANSSATVSFEASTDNSSQWKLGPVYVNGVDANMTGLSCSTGAITKDTEVVYSFVEGQTPPIPSVVAWAAVDGAGGRAYFSESDGVAQTHVELSEGAIVSYKVEPAAGFELAGAMRYDANDTGKPVLGAIAEDVTSLVHDGTLTLSITRDTVVVFSFKPLTATLTPAMGLAGVSHGKVLPDAPQTVEAGQAVRIKLVPENGYVLSDKLAIVLKGADGDTITYGKDDFKLSYDENNMPYYYLDIVHEGAAGGGASAPGDVGVAGGLAGLGFSVTLDAPNKAEIFSPEFVYHTVRANVDSSGTGKGSLSFSSTPVEHGESVTLYCMPESVNGVKSKVAAVTVTDRPVGATQDRVRTFDNIINEFTLINIVSDTNIAVRFDKAENGDVTHEVDAFDFVRASVSNNVGGTVEPADTQFKLPTGGSQMFKFLPDAGWRIAKVYVSSKKTSDVLAAPSVVPVTPAFVDGHYTYTYYAQGGITADVVAEFEKMPVQDNSTAEVSTEVKVVVSGAEAASADVNKYIRIDMPVQTVSKHNDVSFTLTMRDMRDAITGKFYALNKVNAVEKLTQDGATEPVSSDRIVVKALGASGRSGLGRAAFMAAHGAVPMSAEGRAADNQAALDLDAPAYIVTILDVQRDIEINLEVAATSEKAPSEIDVPDSFTLTASSTGPGWVYPLYTDANCLLTGDNKPRFDVYEGAIARELTFTPYGDGFLKSVVAQALDSSGAVVKQHDISNLVIRDSVLPLDAQDLFDVLDELGLVSANVMDGTRVHVLATFEQGGSPVEVATTWAGALLLDKSTGMRTPMDNGSWSLDKPLWEGALNADPQPKMWTVGSSSSFTSTTDNLMIDSFELYGIDADISTDSPFMVVRPLSGTGIVTLTFERDMKVVGVFVSGEPEISYVTIKTPGQLFDGNILFNGQPVSGDVQVVKDGTHIFKLNPATPSGADFKRIVDTVTIDGKRLVTIDGKGNMSWDPDNAFGDWTLERGVFTGILSNGDIVEYNVSSHELTFKKVSAGHEIDCVFSPAVELTVRANGSSEDGSGAGGLISPQGTFMWKVDAVGADGKTVAAIKPVSVYVAAMNGYELGSFKVNDVETAVADAAGDDKVAGEMELFGEDASTGDEGNEPEAQSFFNLFDMKSAKVTTPLKSNYGAVKVYKLGVKDVDGSGTTTVDALFKKKASGGGGGGGGDVTNPAEEFTLTVTVLGGHGKVNGLDTTSVKVKKGADYTFALTPDAGFVVAQVRDNNQTINGWTNSSLTVKNVQADHNITVRFGLPNTPGDDATRTVRKITSMLATGDGSIALMILSLGIALAATGIAVIAATRKRER